MRKPNKDDLRISANLKKFRLASGLTQDEIVKKLEEEYSLVISREQLSHYENGKSRISAGLLQSLSSLFSIKISKFFN